MINKKIKILFLIFISGLTIDKNYLNANCLFDNCKKFDSLNYVNDNYNFLNKKLTKTAFIFESKNISLDDLLGKESDKFKNIFGNLLASNDEIPKDNNLKSSYQIDSDIQYFEGDTFYAEGNVTIFLTNGIIEADKISYDKSKKVFIAYSGLSFKKGDQFLKTDYFEYDFLSRDGYLTNTYGILDFNTINNDLNLKGYLSRDSCQIKNLDLNNLPTEIDLLSSTNERYKNSFGLNKVRFNFSSIKNWRFKSKRIELEENKWTSDLVTFTNDPFNNPQLIIKSKKFVGEVIDNKIKFTSNSTSLNFDDKISIPIIGKRTISGDEEGSLRWGIGYESENKDGFYIMRNFDPLNLNKNLSLDLQPYFLIQRSIQGNSDSFRESKSSVLSENIKKNINVYDYFGLNAKLKGELYNWSINIDADSKTFNKDNFYDAFYGEMNLLKNIYNSSTGDNNNEEKYCNNTNLSDNNKNKYILDLGLYSTFDKDDIYFSYGAKLFNRYNFSNEYLSKDYSVVFDIGKFKGTSLSNNYELKNLYRYGINASLRHTYRLTELKNKLDAYSEVFNKTPTLIDNGLFINAKLSSGLFEYSDGKSQALISLMLGPSYTYGNLKQNLFDYTEISIFPEFVLKTGESPLKYDNFNDDSRIRFNIRQQLYGPFILGFQGNYNINADSSSYGNFENKRISIELSRRAYSLGLSYLEDDKSIFFGFEIFNFGNSKFENNF